MARELFFMGSLFEGHFTLRAVDPQAGDIINAKLSRQGWIQALQKRGLAVVLIDGDTWKVTAERR